MTVNAPKLDLTFPRRTIKEQDLDKREMKKLENHVYYPNYYNLSNKIPHLYRTPRITYCFGLKLAFIYQPDNKELHEYILGKMDFSKLRPYLLEIICFVG